MARYIDADALYKKLYPLDLADKRKYTINAKAVADAIANTPTADVVEVVRCKDCKQSYFVKSCSKYECRKGCGTLKYANDFCSYGERKG